MVVPVRCINKFFKKPCQKPKKKPTIDSIMSSIEAKGFLRPYKPYQPPKDVAERVDRICLSENVNSDKDTRIDDLLLRFKLFTKCIAEFDYSIPNSRLVEIKTIGDLIQFYETPVITTTPLEVLQNIELPPNLYVRQDYLRFHPDTDKMFDGKTAFPQSATLVMGLKYKDKYAGHRPEKPWPIKPKSITD
ncbi:39S ribosomal protein L50, mitochondrial isoform X2 [Copidosoma floridanum]|nr:39S ribosomal protein L50, mitochondrial isoform X2 [Copidosoma floridanum]